MQEVCGVRPLFRRDVFRAARETFGAPGKVAGRGVGEVVPVIVDSRRPVYRMPPVSAHSRRIHAMSECLHTKEEILADYAQLEGIMAVEGRTMSEHDKELLLRLMQGKITRDDVVEAIVRDQSRAPE